MAAGLKEPEHLVPVTGFRLASCAAGIYRQQRHDLVLIEIQENSTAAAVFTRSAFAAAPVIIARRHLHAAMPRYCLINAGNANAGTGERGLSDTSLCCDELANRMACRSNEVLPFSTGVIGEPLPVENITSSLDGLIAGLDDDNWLECARAMMTTDTLAKGASRTILLGGEEVKITGIAKGSGMIKPDMATMLAFVATDAVVEAELLSSLLRESVKISFNRICVDGDTSTNDACLLMASGASGVKPAASGDHLEEFRSALDEVCTELAQAIVRDGEGATKFIVVDIQNGSSEKLCEDIASDIATSPLVKTAMFASDPNWGRIVAAAGRGRIGEIDPQKVSLYINDTCIVKNGEKSASYTESAGQSAMAGEDIHIRLDLAQGEHSCTLWTCDLSHDYITINAEYRT